MRTVLLGKLKESAVSVLPVVAIVFLLDLTPLVKIEKMHQNVNLNSQNRGKRQRKLSLPFFVFLILFGFFTLILLAVFEGRGSVELLEFIGEVV